MTGLDIKKDHLIEIAVLITDGDLNIVAKVSKKWKNAAIIGNVTNTLYEKGARVSYLSV